MKKIKQILRRYRQELSGVILFFVGGLFSLIGLIQLESIFFSIAGVAILGMSLLYYCIKFSNERTYKEYYKDSFEIEHGSIEEEIRKSMTYHRYQEAVLNRYESACRDLGLSDEQRDWLLLLLMDEKKKIDSELNENGGGYI